MYCTCERRRKRMRNKITKNKLIHNIKSFINYVINKIGN